MKRKARTLIHFQMYWLATDDWCVPIRNGSPATPSDRSGRESESEKRKSVIFDSLCDRSLETDYEFYSVNVNAKICRITELLE